MGDWEGVVAFSLVFVKGECRSPGRIPTRRLASEVHVYHPVGTGLPDALRCSEPR